MTEVYAGIDIGGTNIKFGLVDKEGRILHRESRPTMAEKGPVPLLHLVTNIGERLMYYAAEEDFEIQNLGVGTPGAVDFSTGTVIGPCPNIKGWQGTELGAVLRERLNIPVYVDNDVNAMALAEARFGAAVSAGSVICVTLGTGVGGAIIIDGKLWRGATSSAGEIGHMTINYDSTEDGSKMVGSLESYCSSKAILARVKTILEKKMTPVFQSLLDGECEKLTIRKLFEAVRKNDAVAKASIDEAAEFLGIGLAGVVNLLNPESVVIGGGIVSGGGGFVQAVAQEIRKRAFDSAVSQLTIVKAALGNDAGFIGAGLLGEMNTKCVQKGSVL